jgi:hypothetical protein
MIRSDNPTSTLRPVKKRRGDLFVATGVLWERYSDREVNIADAQRFTAYDDNAMKVTLSYQTFQQKHNAQR